MSSNLITNNTFTFFTPQNFVLGETKFASVAREDGWTQHVVQQLNDQVQKVGFNAHIDSTGGVTFVALLLLDMLSDALEFRSKKSQLVWTFTKMLGLGGAHEAASARQKDAPLTRFP